MNFDDLCRDFDRRRPKGPIIQKTPWFIARWSDGARCINDMLTRFLKENGYKYLNNLGVIWILYRDSWTRTEYQCEGDAVQFFLCEFINN